MLDAALFGANGARVAGEIVFRALRHICQLFELRPIRVKTHHRTLHPLDCAALTFELLAGEIAGFHFYMRWVNKQLRVRAGLDSS